jgi:UDP-glucose 4-epimerase
VIPQTLDGMTVFIAGANGFLGSHLLARLREWQTNVHAVSLNAPVEVGEARWWQGNVANFSWTRELIDYVKPDVIYQLCSAGMDGQESDLVLSTFECDLCTTVNVLAAARESGCQRVIITRSFHEPLLSGENPSPASPYAAAKAASGLYGRMFHQLYGLPVVMLRPFVTYGPGQKVHRLIPFTIQSMLRGHAPALPYGVGDLDWVYVDDIIDAFLAAATSAEAPGMEIDLGSGVLTPMRDVIGEIQRLIPGAPPATFSSVPDRVNEQARTADLHGAQIALAWRATIPLSVGLARTVEWYRQRLESSAVA